MALPQSYGPVWGAEHLAMAAGVLIAWLCCLHGDQVSGLTRLQQTGAAMTATGGVCLVRPSAFSRGAPSVIRLMT
jgi:hypothetical protein